MEYDELYDCRGRAAIDRYIVHQHPVVSDMSWSCNTYDVEMNNTLLYRIK